jgi:hypothetical protein
MSEPKRYEYVSDGYTARFINPKTGHSAPYGEYVGWEDYAKVKEAGQNMLQHLRESTSEVERLKSEVERLTEIIDSFKTMPIIEGQSFNGWKLDEHHRLVSLVEYLRDGSIEGAKQFTHKEYREFQKTMIEKNAAKEGKHP